MKTVIRPRTVKLISKFLCPLTAEGLITVPEQREILADLRHLADSGTLMPIIAPKLINQKEVAEMLGVRYSNFKMLEKGGAFPFRRKMVGSAVRYRNLDVLKFVMSE